MAEFARTVIVREFEGLAKKMAVRTCVLDWRSRELEEIPPR